MVREPDRARGPSVPGSSGRSGRRCGEIDPERGAATGAFLDPRSSIVQLSEAGDERKPNAGPGGVGERRAVAEGLEDRGPQRLGNTRTRVLHSQKHSVIEG